MIDIFVAPEVGIIMKVLWKTRNSVFNFLFPFFFFKFQQHQGVLRRQGFYLCAVYLHGQRPSSTSAPKVFHVTVDRNLLWTKHQRVYLTSSRPFGKKVLYIGIRHIVYKRGVLWLSTHQASVLFGILQLKQFTLYLLSYVVLLLARRKGIDCEEDNNAILKPERIENIWKITTLKEAPIDIIRKGTCKLRA